MFGGKCIEASSLWSIRTYNDTVKLKKRDGTLVATYKVPLGKLLAAVLSPDGQAIAMANVEKIVQIWHRDRPAPQTLKGHQAEVWHVVFSPNGRLVGSASGDGTAKLWTLDGKLFRTLVGHTAAVWRVAFSQDSKMVASGSGDNTVKVWMLDGEPALCLLRRSCANAQRLRQEKKGIPPQATGVSAKRAPRANT